ncbi:nuclear transport factor 2 family protein [Novosphingobium sp. G106]|uniref:nuclear transport factor 2 family protein n=1 Tax=Novosphingobium sp. G106 TaxID=2849500 RepID=UPI001C2D965D|nr:nuclear transport factor 2 family protein [Novosphingobium sp. G106]MBV1688402.1 nuclear transport factor 2 family protein [Novosphingobium sp. G106]
MTQIEIVERFLDAFLARDADTAAGFVTEDFRLEAVPTSPQVLVGRDALCQVLREANLGFPRPLDGASHETGRCVSEGALVMQERVDRFRFEGHRLELRIASIFQFRDGVICSETDYFDMNSYVRMMASVGVELRAVG